MRPASSRGRARFGPRASLGLVLLAAAAAAAVPAGAAGCSQPVYLTFDTGHMGVAPLVAEVLQRHAVKATFFLANERTQTGGGSLDDQWAPWWKARAAEGHAFGSHTWDHLVWQADTGTSMRLRPTAGPQAGRTLTLTPAQYCAELRRPAERFQAMTGAAMLPLFRAPAGRTSPALLAAAKACGFTHVGWSPAGFLGDELPSDKYPNDKLLAQALQRIRPGDILLAHLGIWSRQDPWAPAVLEPLITGLQRRGFCFATLREHPQYGAR
ncbi:polysaccharide deacetylase family protein [Aquincola sp. MAHUQ-54]|uniref:Polysaccharide deacetylase family protein n=1 Tax=Aquincola agrisoli TaxID=3119538 RepID=A0AAW9PYP4_9BURK